MCGINGIFAYHPASSSPQEGELLRTRDAMAARGPDGQGIYWNQKRRIGMGHRRLAIQDLSDRANQPMHCPQQRFTIVFNGEIYNCSELRRELIAQGYGFRTTSDTEVLLQLYAAEGAAMVSRLRGMFAFAIWDNQQETLFLARDPYGMKPMYSSDDGWTFRFANQVKALLSGGNIGNEPEPAGIVGFHIWGSVPEPFTLYRDIRALPAGHTQLIRNGHVEAPKPFVSIAGILASGAQQTPSLGNFQSDLRQAALDSVKAHLIGDVEVGIFLSSGLDSGALLGLMRDAGQQRVRALTLSFAEFVGTQEDETPLASQVAAHYGAEHIVRKVTQAEFQADLPNIMSAMDQPSIDGINSWFISKAAKEVGLKVVLSGTGGDELLAGYSSFIDVPNWVKFLRGPSLIPGAAAASRLLARISGISTTSPKSLGFVEFGGTYEGSYLLRRGLFLPRELCGVLSPDVLTLGLKRLGLLERISSSLQPDPDSPIGRVCAMESANYLRNQLLRDADWASMAHSLELRTPLVDSVLLSQIAPYMPQMRALGGKATLAVSPCRPLPEEVLVRRKTGFVVPVSKWIRNDAKNSAVLAANMGQASRQWALKVIAAQTTDAERKAQLINQPPIQV